MANNKLTSILYGRPDLNWFSSNVDEFNDNLALEAILNYGDWQDFQLALKTIGLKEAKEIFTQLATTQRSNLRPEIKHYFNLYFAQHA